MSSGKTALLEERGQTAQIGRGRRHLARASLAETPTGDPPRPARCVAASAGQQGADGVGDFDRCEVAASRRRRSARRGDSRACSVGDDRSHVHSLLLGRDPADAGRRRRPRVGAQVEVHHRCLRRVGDDLDAGDARRARRDRAGVRDIGGHPRQAQPQPGQPGRGVRPQREQRAAVPLAPQRAPRRSRPRRRAACCRPARRDPCRTRRRRCRTAPRSRTAGGRRTARLPQSRTVEVDGRASVSRAGDLRDEIVPAPAAGRRSRAAAARTGAPRAARGPPRDRPGSAARARRRPSARPGRAAAGRPCPRGARDGRSGGTRRRCRPRRSAWIRSAICWAIVPLGMNTAAGLPSSSRTSRFEDRHRAALAVFVDREVVAAEERRELGEHLDGRTEAVTLAARDRSRREALGARRRRGCPRIAWCVVCVRTEVRWTRSCASCATRRWCSAVR